MENVAFLDALGESINRAACVVLGDFAARIEVLRYVLQPLETNGSYNGAGALYAERCGLPLPANFSPSAPFSGGQCPGVTYRVTVAWTENYDGSQGGSPYSIPQTGQVLILGAVQGAVAQYDGAKLSVVITGGTVGELGVIVAGSPEAIQAFNHTNVQITAVVREDGLPDECGNPQPVIPPYMPGSNVVNENVTIINNEGDTVTIPVVLAFGYAVLNLDGTVNIPVNANFTANAQLNGTFNFNLNTGGTTPDISNPSAPRPPSCSDPSGYSPSPDIPAPPPEIPDAPPTDPPTTNPVERRQLLAGAIVTVTEPESQATIIFQGENPDIYAPALGYVQFLIQVGASSAWTADIPVKCKRQFIPCPWEGGAIDVAGSPRFGSVFEVTPVYTTRTFNPTYPPDTIT